MLREMSGCFGTEAEADEYSSMTTRDLVSSAELCCDAIARVIRSKYCHN